MRTENVHQSLSATLLAYALARLLVVLLPWPSAQARDLTWLGCKFRGLYFRSPAAAGEPRMLDVRSSVRTIASVG